MVSQAVAESERCCGAAPQPGLLSRRAVLAGGPLICVSTGPASAEARALLSEAVTIDAHSHAGALIGMWRVDDDAPFEPLAAPMRAGGMAVACLAIVPDAPALRSVADTRRAPFHTPLPGELRTYGERAFARLHALARSEGLKLIRSAADLRAARATTPAVIVASEGGDFLEGDPAGVDAAFGQWSLRHLQLTHYRVNELGDIQTEAPVHGGLTPIGVDVIRRCNRVGIVVDVAHGTFDLVRQAASVTTRPLLLSHTSLIDRPGPRMRRISPDHARAVAATGGVIGVWPPSNLFGSHMALAEGMARMADVVGPQHVGLGTDLGGLLGHTCFADYGELPLLADALLRVGFGPDDVRAMLGGNYARVALATLPAA